MLLRSVFDLSAGVSVLAFWLLWLPGLGVRWSPGQPTLVPVVFWFSSPVLVVFWSPDALILWSSTLFVSQFLGLLVLSFPGPVAMMSRNCKLVSMGFVLVVGVFCFSEFQLDFAK